MFSRKQFQISLLVLSIAALLPFVIICFYALPFADDFCFGWTASEKISFVQKFLNQYLYWNGRYTADVLVNFHPLVTGKILVYQFSILVPLLATPVIFYFLLDSAVSNNQSSLINYQFVIASLLITLFYLNYQPNITEGIYWFIGISNYHLGNLCLLLHFIFLLKAFSANGKSKITFQTLASLLLVVSIGFNEIGALLIPLFYFFVLVFSAKTESRKFFAGLFLIAFVSSSFVFFSPGNFVRVSVFPERYILLHSLLYSSAQTLRFLSKWIFNLPFILLSLVIVANADKVKLKLPVLDFRVLAVALLFVVFSGSFIPYFATGVLGQHRTINYVFFYFILIWFLLVISVSQKYLLYEKLNWLKQENRIFATMTISVLMMMFSGNSLKILQDCNADNFRKYETAFYERQKTILQKPDAQIAPLEIVPDVFTITDAENDTAYWVDKCMKKYYTETGNELK